METKSTPDGPASPPPLDRLLDLGEMGARRREWRDYLALGFTAERVPELLRVAADEELHGADSDDSRVYAPIHAWRVLGQLRAAEAAAPLAKLLLRYEDDWAREELPRALGLIGEPAIEPARAVMANEFADSYTRAAAAAALHEAAVRHPDLRDGVVSLLTEQLRAWPEQGETVNGFLIDYLTELGAVEAAPLMQAAFEAGLVDTFIRGDWEDVQVDLGLLEERLTPPRPPAWFAEVERRSARPATQPAPASNPAVRARELRKAQKQARKRKRGK